MSGRYSKNKGYRAENELVHKLIDNGLKAVRVPLSGACEGFKSDIILDDIHECEVKIRKTLNNMLYEVLEDQNIAFVRADRKEWIVLLDFDFFCSLWKQINGHGCRFCGASINL